MIIIKTIHNDYLHKYEGKINIYIQGEFLCIDADTILRAIGNDIDELDICHCQV